MSEARAVRVLESRDFHRAHTKYQHLKLLRTELDLRAVEDDVSRR